MTHPLRVALLQLRAHALADHEQAWRELLARIDDAAREGPRWIVIPEGAYPAWHLVSPDALREGGSRPDGDVVAELGERARTHDCYIAIGLPLRDGAALRNAALLITPEGRLARGATETTPAAPWFSPGSGPAPAGPDGVRVGLVAGRDLEDPHALAPLAAEGVGVIVATGVATSPARTSGAGEPPRRRYLAAARAVELGAWVVLPGLVGVEAGMHRFAGEAGVVDPTGRWQVRGPAAQAGIVMHTFDPDAAPGPRVVARSNLRAAPPAGEAPPLARGGAVACDRTPSVVELMEGLRALVQSAATMGLRLLVLPDLAGHDQRAITRTETLPLLEALSRETRTVLLVGLAERADGETHKTVFVVDGGTTLASQRQAHLTAEERQAGFAPGDDAPRVVATSAGAIGLLGGADALVPSLAAELRAGGARAIAWCASGEAWSVEGVARARAREAGVPVFAAGGTSETGGGFVVDDRGRLLAATAPGETGCAWTEDA